MKAIEFNHGFRTSLSRTGVGIFAAAVCVGASAQTTLYDSNGFEVPENGTPLTSLPGVSQPPESTGTATEAFVTNGVAATDMQSLQINRNPNNVIDEFLIKLEPATDSGVLTFNWQQSFAGFSDDFNGTLIGISLTDERNDQPTNFVAGGLFIDTEFGDFVYYESDGDLGDFSVLGGVPADGDPGLAVPGTFYDFTAIYDLDNRTAFYQVSGGDLDDAIVASDVPFFDEGFFQASRLNINTIATFDADTATGTAFIDDLVATSTVPEPGSLLIAGLAGVALIGRRRRAS